MPLEISLEVAPRRMKASSKPIAESIAASRLHQTSPAMFVASARLPQKLKGISQSFNDIAIYC